MKYVFNLIRLFYNLSLIAKNEKNTAAALRVADCLNKLGLLDAEVEAIRQDTNGRRYLEQRRMLKQYKLEELVQLPAGSVGQIYAQHMIDQNLQPDFYEILQIKCDVTYVMMRMRETHDLWHIMTGFSTEVPGELGLQAFMFAQLQTPLAPILIAGRTLISTFRNPKEVVQVYDHIAKGWAMGRHAKLIFGLDWDENWSRPLSEVRSEFNLQAI